jgi:hypothetical protein
MVPGFFAKQFRDRISMIPTESGCHAVSALLRVLARESATVKTTNEPVTWLQGAKRGDSGLKFIGVTAVITGSLGPLSPLLFPHDFVMSFVKTPDLSILPVVVAGYPLEQRHP